MCKTCNIPFNEICQKISNNDHPDMTKPKPKHKKHKYVCNKNSKYVLLLKMYCVY